MYIVEIQSNIRVVKDGPIQVRIRLYKEDEWIGEHKNSSVDVSLIELSPRSHNGVQYFEFDLKKTLREKGIDNKVLYVNVFPQGLYRKVHTENKIIKTKELIVGGIESYRTVAMLDDCLYEYENCYEIIDKIKTEVLIIMINRNQIPRFREHCNIDPDKVIFVPRTCAVLDTYWRNPLDNWDKKFPAIAYSVSCCHGERKTFVENLSRSTVPHTIMNYYPLLLEYSDYCEDHARFSIMKEWVLKMYGTHLMGVNLPRHPLEATDSKDPGHFVYRILEITGSQCALLQRKIPLESGFYCFFKPGVSCVEWTTFEDFKSKTDYYLRHQNQILNIARKGYEVASGVCSTANTRKVIFDFVIKGTPVPIWARYE